MSIWDEWAGEAEAGRPAPYIPDGEYKIKVLDVSEPEDRPRFNDPTEMVSRFFVAWGISYQDDDGKTQETSIRQYMSVPDSYLNDRVLTPRTTIYKVMDALGYDMPKKGDGKTVRVYPPEWKGKEAKAFLKQERDDEDNPLGWPKVVELARLTRRGPARQPVAAGRGEFVDPE